MTMISSERGTPGYRDVMSNANASTKECVIPLSFAGGGRERDLTMRLDDHGSKQEHRGSVQDIAYQRCSTILATSGELHTHRKVPLLRSSDRRFGMTNQF